MDKLFKLIYLILILTLNFSCVEKKSSKKEISESEFVSPSKTDTLKFTSGIRSIFQDSKRNYWFGSHQEGVCLFDGKSFEYFTTNEGLSDNQIRSIQEDENGKIWFGTANGVSSYIEKKSLIILQLDTRTHKVNGKKQTMTFGLMLATMQVYIDMMAKN